MASTSPKDLVLKLRSLTNEFRTDTAVAELDALDKSLAAAAKQSRESARDVKTAAADYKTAGTDIQTAARDVDGAAGTVKTSGTQIEGAFDKAGAEAEATARRMRAAAEDMASGVRTGATKIDAETNKIRTDMSETGKEAGAELVSNIAEGIGSGSGSITDVIQGTLGGITNMAASIPGPFAVAGAAAAAGVGILFSAIKKQSEESKERVKSLTAAILESGDASAKAARQAAWDQWVAALNSGEKDAQRLAKGMAAAGLSAADVRAAVSGTPKEAQRVLDKISAVQKKNNEYLLDTENVTAEFIDQNSAVLDLEKELRGTNSELSLARDTVSAIEKLTGNTKGNFETQSEKLDKLWRKAREYGDAMDYATRDRTQNTTVVVRDQTGRNIRLPDPRLTR